MLCVYWITRFTFCQKNASPYEHLLHDKECRYTLKFCLKDCAARHNKHWSTKIQYFCYLPWRQHCNELYISRLELLINEYAMCEK